MNTTRSQWYTPKKKKWVCHWCGEEILKYEWFANIRDTDLSVHKECIVVLKVAETYGVAVELPHPRGKGITFPVSALDEWREEKRRQHEEFERYRAVGLQSRFG